MSESSLVLGNFLLTDPAGTAHGAGVESEGTGRGNPVPIELAVKSWLQDGSIVVTQGYDNREVNIRVRMWGTDLAALAEAEAALFAEIGKPNQLAWTPPDGYGATSVFVVITSSLEQDDSSPADLYELQRSPFRWYNVRLVCEAFVRSVNPVTTAAALPGTATTPPTPTVATVDDGSSATSWSAGFRVNTAAPAALSPSASGGYVTVTTPVGAEGADASTAVVSLTRTGSIDTSVTKQLRVKWAWSQSPAGGPWYASSFRLVLNGSVVPRLTYGPMPGQSAAGTAVFLVPDDVSSVSSLTFEVTYSLAANVASASSSTQTLSIDSVTRDNANATGTPRELIRQIAVKGSARTQGSVTISHESSALGDVLAYFWPLLSDRPSYSPPLRQYRVNGPLTYTDANSVSGATETLPSVGGSDPATRFEIPSQALASGSHLLQMRLGGSGATVLRYSVTTVVAGVDVGPSEVHDISVNLTAFDGDDVFTLGRLQLPTRDVGSVGVVRLDVAVVSGASVTLDEGWLFNTTIGQLTHVVCGSGSPSSSGPANRVWIEPATIAKPRPTVRIGSLASGADARFPALLRAWTPPQFTPSAVNVCTVTTTAVGASVTLMHAARWHTHAAA